MDYSTNNFEFNSHNLSNFPDFIENCLKMLANFTLMLFHKNEKLESKSKLIYCYCYFNEIRWQLENPTSLQHNVLVDIAKTIIKRLQNSLGLLHIPIDYLMISNDYSKSGSILNSVLAKYNVCTKKTKRKSKFSKIPEETVKLNKTSKIFNRLCGNISGKNSETLNTMEYIIDQMYIQIRTVLSEYCIDDTDIFTELSGFMNDDDTLCKIIMETKRLPPITQKINNGRYQGELCTGDCQLNYDYHHIISDEFDNLISSNNAHIDINSLTDKILSPNSKFDFHKNFEDSELDEGFSENEYLHDEDYKFESKKSAEYLPHEQFSYCGDCHYNSSNSKSGVDLGLDCKDVSSTHNDDGSDSDGGTELLNSVNESLDKFNAFMQHIFNTDCEASSNKKTSDYSIKSGDQPVIENLLPVCHNTVLDSKVSFDDNPELNIQKKPFNPNELLIFETNDHTSPLVFSPPFKDERYEAKISSVNNLPSLSPVPSLSKLKYESVSKLLVSPVNNIPNWCSYNFSTIASPTCSFGYHSKPPVDVDRNISNGDSFCVGKLSSWLPPISHGLISTNSYIIGSNNPQQPFHRIVLSPHPLPIPTGNVGPIQHNIVHLPQIFHQIPHSMIDTDYFDHRQIPLNQPQTQFSNPDNNNSSCDFSISPTSLLFTNSNSSNTAVTSNLHKPISIMKASVDKSQRACCFYMRGGCKKEDCEYAHDLSKVTCKFWEKGDCFKADTCPFKHGYMRD